VACSSVDHSCYQIWGVKVSRERDDCCTEYGGTVYRLFIIRLIQYWRRHCLPKYSRSTQSRSHSSTWVTVVVDIHARGKRVRKTAHCRKSHQGRTKFLCVVINQTSRTAVVYIRRTLTLVLEWRTDDYICI